MNTLNKFGSYADQSIRIVSSLDVGSLPAASRSRVLVDLVHDGLGRAMRAPVVVVRGRRDGPVFGVTAALHGNELNGIPVTHQLVDRLEPANLRGTVVIAPVLNIPGFLRMQREFGDGKDLNHMMPGQEGGDEAQVYARRILDRVVAPFDYLVDLHTASFGRVNSLYVRADMRDPTTARMAYLQRPHIILHNPASDSTLRGVAAERGVPAITVEVGDPQVFQTRHVKATLAGVKAVLCELGMIARRAPVQSPPPIVCIRSQWLYTDHGGLLEVYPGVGERIVAGERIACQRDIFGDVVREYHAPYDAIVIGKSVNPVSPTGARIAHIGQLATPEDGLLSPDASRLGAH